MQVPSARPVTRKFHIIQPAVVNQKKRSPGCKSRCNAKAFRCSSRIPPWLCTIGLGIPVVPDEKRIQSGWSNSTGVKENAVCSLPPVKSAQDVTETELAS